MEVNLNFTGNTSLPTGDIWLKGLFGVEKENIRIDKNGVISQTPHPAVFGDKLNHPYITTDFSESQVEMITPPLPGIPETLGFLETIHDIVSLELEDEYLWPQSIPPIIPNEDQIPVAQYSNEGSLEEAYREKLAEKYGKKKQVISGIHFNISLNDNLLSRLYQITSTEISFELFKDEVYLKITRQLLRYRWLYVLIYGSSPIVDPTYELKCRDLPVYFNSKTRGLSLRNSCFGYGNIEDLYPDYRSTNGYLHSIEQMVNNGTLTATKELYASVRPKFTSNAKTISYIEARFLDINPLSKIGLTPAMLHFIHFLVIYGLVTDEQDNFSPDYQAIANSNHANISLLGLHGNIPYFKGDGSVHNAWEEAKVVIQGMMNVYSTLGIESPDYFNSLKYAKEMILHPEQRIVQQILNEMDLKGFIPFHLGKAKDYLQQSKQNTYNFKGLEDIELSTQLVLREAVRRGIAFDIMDKTENFIRLKRDDNTQYVRQATKTSLDNYASILAMENKVITKQILKEHGIRVPIGLDYSDRDIAKADFPYFKNRAVVIKPKSTNFGLGITIIKNNTDNLVFERAIDIAFDCDSSILIEEFIEGKEFRIFVMNDEVVGILHRVPANVTGDGKQSIRELVIDKNKDPLRGKGYRTPLEKIQLGEAESMFLKAQGKDFEYVPADNEKVFLRENSNISTGGDSIDFTDDIPESYKRIAVQAAQALGVKITGLDMIIPDYTQEATNENYAIIELNFNPAIHIHCHPYKGKNRKLNEKLLDILGFPVITESLPDLTESQIESHKQRLYLKFECCELIRNFNH
ncbi:MAG: bifunctional glutamate--cysteine ligase GshA/glutathione synthetase GshB [Paludibacter sp.]|nr:bifunctional glutamate--cysteine ligase GshA/glutathione synthetase GshB [Paludibacter sp.]